MQKVGTGKSHFQSDIGAGSQSTFNSKQGTLTAAPAWGEPPAPAQAFVPPLPADRQGMALPAAPAEAFAPALPAGRQGIPLPSAPGDSGSLSPRQQVPLPAPPGASDSLLPGQMMGGPGGNNEFGFGLLINMLNCVLNCMADPPVPATARPLPGSCLQAAQYY